MFSWALYVEDGVCAAVAERVADPLRYCSNGELRVDVARRILSDFDFAATLMERFGLAGYDVDWLPREALQERANRRGAQVVFLDAGGAPGYWTVVLAASSGRGGVCRSAVASACFQSRRANDMGAGISLPADTTMLDEPRVDLAAHELFHAWQRHSAEQYYDRIALDPGQGWAWVTEGTSEAVGAWVQTAAAQGGRLALVDHVARDGRKNWRTPLNCPHDRYKAAEFFINANGGNLQYVPRLLEGFRDVEQFYGEDDLAADSVTAVSQSLASLIGRNLKSALTHVVHERASIRRGYPYYERWPIRDLDVPVHVGSDWLGQLSPLSAVTLYLYYAPAGNGAGTGQPYRYNIRLNAETAANPDVAAWVGDQLTYRRSRYLPDVGHFADVTVLNTSFSESTDWGLDVLVQDAARRPVDPNDPLYGGPGDSASEGYPGWDEGGQAPIPMFVKLLSGSPSARPCGPYTCGNEPTFVLAVHTSRPLDALVQWGAGANYTAGATGGITVGDFCPNSEPGLPGGARPFSMCFIVHDNAGVSPPSSGCRAFVLFDCG